MSPIHRRKFLKGSIFAATAGLSAGRLFAQDLKHDPLIDEDALGLAAMLRAREISQLELLEIFIRRIEVMNPALNFMTNEAFDRARKAAGTIPLNTRFAGVPILMKDMIDIAGLRRTDGSRLMLENRPERNVAYVDAVEQAGLNIFGQTNVPEMASFVITNNDVFGATRNPWSPDHSVFSSSGGSAVAVASGVVPIAHGTDGAGSNRLPPSATGILGMKPSRNRMRSGEAGGGHDIAKTNHVLTRTVRDSAAVFAETEDPSGKMYEPVGFVDGSSKRRLKVGLVRPDGALMTSEPEVLDAQQRAGRLLEKLGHSVEETPWPVDAEEMADAYMKFFAGKVGALKKTVETVSGKPLMESGLLTPLLASNILSSAAFTEKDIAQGRDYLAKLESVFEKVFENFDVLLAPVAPVVAPPLYEHTPQELWSDELAQYVSGRLKYTSPINFSGCPAMSVPLGRSRSSGIPIGSHFIAAKGAERLLYELAYELEEARPWRGVWAPYSLKYIPV
ncbi:amidase [Haloferula sp.]|uniref:amidase n=1 Tax=Haloferula sp. TaxID=2497595 RepID=UPI00329D9808